MTVHKYPDLRSLKASSELYWNTMYLQPFFPPLEKLFKTNILENASEYGIKFENEITSIIAPNTIKVGNNSMNVHRKITMLLNPFKYMQGDYGNTLSLPNFSEHSKKAHEKISSHNNAAYVGAIISATLSASGCQHFPTVYGLFTGLSKSHTIDISDDYEDLCDRSWFSQNMGNTFTLKLNDLINNSSEFRHTRSARAVIQLGDEDLLGDVQELEGIQSNVEMGELKSMYREEIEDDGESDSSSVSTSYIFGIESCRSFLEETEVEDDEESGDDEEPFAWATFSNVPVQITLMETCEGTLYKLITDHPDPEKHLAWISQVIFALAFAQRNFSFIHNDLHANNVMYVPTTQEYLFYNVEGAFYKIPTYGFLIKIIDFERSIISLKLNGLKESKLFFSDHFSLDEEAGGQYNCEPFYNSKFPQIKPNPSFDLVRLATSMFWDLFPAGPSNENDSLLYKLFMKWLTLDDGTSILFGKNEPKHDRFHGFHLYKAIARFCKDTAVPRKEILSLKSTFGVTELPHGVKVCLIE